MGANLKGAMPKLSRIIEKSLKFGIIFERWRRVYNM